MRYDVRPLQRRKQNILDQTRFMAHLFLSEKIMKLTEPDESDESESERSRNVWRKNSCGPEMTVIR